MRLLTAIGFGTGCLLLAASEPRPEGQKQKVQVSSTQRFDFPAGGTLRLKNSTGFLTIEAWDRPDVEITTIKSSKAEYSAGERGKELHRLESVRVSAERRGDELVITTDYPRYRIPDPLPSAGRIKFELEYRIKAPAAARIVDDHGVGDVNIDGMAGDIDVTLHRGEIVLHLGGDYKVHAKSAFGTVKSDFTGEEKDGRWHMGEAVNGNAAASHNLNLRVGFGDIILLKSPKPLVPEPQMADTKPEGF